MNRLLITLNNYCLYLLVFSITFENWDPFKLVGTLSITYMASVLYIMSSIPLLKNAFNLNLFRNYAFPLFGFIITGLVATALNSAYLIELKEGYNYRVLLLIILMLLLANHFYSNEKILTKTLNVYVASILLMFLLYVLGVGVEYVSGRPRIFGENPNILGMKALIAFLIVLTSVFENKFSFKRLFVSVLVLGPMLTLVVASGSRGAFLSVFMGLILLILFMKMSLGKKILFAILGFVASTFFFFTVLSENANFRSRLMDTIETGDIGRGLAWVGAKQVIENNLILGVGFPGALPEMNKVIGIAMDPHNVFLYILMTTGIVGFFFFMVFIWRLWRALFSSYKKTGRILFIIILIIILMNMAKAGGGIGMTLFWFFFAVLIGSTFSSRKNTTESIDISVSHLNT